MSGQKAWHVGWIYSLQSLHWVWFAAQSLFRGYIHLKMSIYQRGSRILSQERLLLFYLPSPGWVSFKKIKNKRAVPLCLQVAVAGLPVSISHQMALVINALLSPSLARLIQMRNASK